MFRWDRLAWHFLRSGETTLQVFRKHVGVRISLEICHVILNNIYVNEQKQRKIDLDSFKIIIRMCFAMIYKNQYQRLPIWFLQNCAFKMILLCFGFDIIFQYEATSDWTEDVFNWSLESEWQPSNLKLIIKLASLAARKYLIRCRGHKNPIRAFAWFLFIHQNDLPLPKNVKVNTDSNHSKSLIWLAEVHYRSSLVSMLYFHGRNCNLL